MLALTATAVSICPSAHGFSTPPHPHKKIQFALEDIVAGRRSPFSEKDCREKYRSHLNTIQDVKISSDTGDLKYARMMSNIYQGMM